MQQRQSAATAAAAATAVVVALVVGVRAVCGGATERGAADEFTVQQIGALVGAPRHKLVGHGLHRSAAHTPPTATADHHGPNTAHHRHSAVYQPARTIATRQRQLTEATNQHTQTARDDSVEWQRSGTGHGREWTYTAREWTREDSG